MTTNLQLRFAYIANVVILTPVVGSLLITGSTNFVFGASVVDSSALRILVMSLWSAILICSVAGLRWPRTFVGILALQVVYKTMWLLLYALPAWHRKDFTSWGPALTFIPIILLWPFILRNVARESNVTNGHVIQDRISIGGTH